MDRISQTNVFYLFIDQGGAADSRGKASFSRIGEFVEQEISFSEQFPKSTIVQIIRNKDYGLKEMIRQQRSFNYESYFFNGGLTRNPEQVRHSEAHLELQNLPGLPRGARHLPHRGRGQRGAVRAAVG